MTGPLALAAMLLAATAAGEVEPGPSPEVAAENAERGAEVFRIRMRNRAGGAVEVSRDLGETWLRIGGVTAPATAVNRNGYTASRWAADGGVAACAVNAIHVKVGANPETGRGVVFSIIPAGRAVGAARGRGSSSIATDIPAGTAIFGGGLAPYVNCPVLVAREGELRPLGAAFVPMEGDLLVIPVTEPPTEIAWIEFDNSFGGLIRVHDVSGEERVIGSVLRPVVGVGRFSGTREAAPGRIRANHPGVIDISTSPLGMIGGFQIVPSGHADSPETTYIRLDTQWMVVGPVNALDGTWEGVAPLFSGYLAPNYRADDITGRHEDWLRRTLARCQVQVRIDGGPWRLMPRIALDPDAPEDADDAERGREGLWRIRASMGREPLPEEARRALMGVTHIRIVMPRAQFWPAREADGR